MSGPPEETKGTEPATPVLGRVQPVAPANGPIVRSFRFWLVLLVVVLIGTYLLRSVLLPFVAGMAVAYLLDPVCDRLERWKLSRTWATTIVTVVFLLICAVILLILVPAVISQVVTLIERAPAYLNAIQREIGSLIEMLKDRLEPATLERLQEALRGSADKVIAWITKLLGGVISGGVAFINFVALLVITPVVAFYLLRDWDRLVEQADDALPRKHLETIRGLAKQVDETLAGFLRGQGMVCLLLALFYAIGLTLAGLDFGLVIGLIAGFLSFIPYVGSLVGLFLSVGLALAQFDSFADVAIVAAVFFVGQAIEGNVLTPKLVGEKVGLHPVWVMFALLAGGSLFGFVGVLLAVPVAAIVGVGVRFGIGQYRVSHYYTGVRDTAGGEDKTGPEKTE
ncbi:AI-2E family transporter [Pelagibius litoralis]|uniref:AI-2E family transporter n=1 Tax=Pelagibius litoralis TaxID=374515 RepID=A0A967EZK1_9PROT|nr:AI-2E family transporter [Pelagibius litoralis]